MAAGQRDIPVLLQPGSGATVRAPGEFMYLAFADREILAIVTGLDGTQSRLKMVTGDHTKPAGGIEEVELVNPDPDNACAVTVIIGAGEFDRKIIQGEVTVNPGVRGADGTFRADSRTEIGLTVTTLDRTRTSVTAGQLRYQISPAEVVRNVSACGTLICALLDDGTDRVLAAYEVRTGREIWRRVLYSGTSGIWGITAPPATVCVTTSGIALYATVGSSLSRLDLSLEGALISSIEVDTNVSDVTYSPVRAEYLATGGGGVVYVSPDGISWSKSELLSALSPSTVAAAGNEILVRTSGANINRYTWRGSLIGPAAVNGYAFRYTDQLDAIITWTQGVAGQPIRVYAASDRTEYLSGAAALRPCAGATLINEPIYPTTQAVGIDGDRAQGAIIGAVLEMYLAGLGYTLPADYLDSVFGVRIESTGIEISSGGSSFAAAKIPDDFRARLPGRIVVTVDNTIYQG